MMTQKTTLRERLTDIRAPRPEGTIGRKLAVTAGIGVAGALLGVFQKWLDSMAVGELPRLFQMIDLTNLFGRIAIWILLATVIAVFAPTPRRASLNTFVFFAGMLAGYYVYCQFVLGFLPVSYMMIWVVLAFVSLPLAYICWYARGEGRVSTVISGGILGVLLAQTFWLVQGPSGFCLTHAAELVILVVGAIVLHRDIKQTLIALGISVPAAVLCQLFLPYWA